MRLIAGPRNCGKSTKLVKIAKATNGYILVHNGSAADALIALGMAPNRILRISELQVRNNLDGPLYVDNMELCFDGMLSVISRGRLHLSALGTISIEDADIDSMINKRIVEDIILNPEES